tara:strand:+ start:693 stop:1292 length:600 start_codon:yes stop_codon:yes gene_type:complete
MYVEPKIESSYYINNKGSKLEELYFKPNIGKTIYDYVIENKPKVIVEFGVLFGFSTVCMAQALRDLNNGGRIYAFDLWEKSKYNHGQTIELVDDILKEYELQDFVKLDYGGSADCLSGIKDVDLIHIDVNNDGDRLMDFISDIKNKHKVDCDILFEGGIVERDNCWWMNEFKKTPINYIKNTFDYTILNKNYPGISKCI